MITVGRLAPFDQWDQNMLDLLFANELYATGLEFKRVDGYPVKADGCVLIIPGRYWFEKTNAISEAISRFEWVLAIRTGDEENLLDPEKVYHPNIRWWVQNPKVGFDYPEGSRFMGCGFPSHFNQLTQQERDTDVFLSAQNTNARRNECFTALGELRRGNKIVEPTAGFTQGMEPADYAVKMCATKIAPAPSGPESPDSFRLFEALEAHCVPIADDLSPKSDSEGFWRMVFPDAPFPIITDYRDLPGYAMDQMALWPANANRIAAWWMAQKRAMAKNLNADLQLLGAL